jgi:hypothetical protein
MSDFCALGAASEPASANHTDTPYAIPAKIERPADIILIVLIENDPEPQSYVEPRSASFHFGNLDGKAGEGGWLVIGNDTSRSSPFGLMIRTPTATGRGLRPSVSPRSASRTQR